MQDRTWPFLNRNRPNYPTSSLGHHQVSTPIQTYDFTSN